MNVETQRQLLLIDDEPAQVRLVGAIATRAGWRTTACPSVDAAAPLLTGRGAVPFDTILLDRWMPDGAVADTVSRLTGLAPSAPIVVITAQGSTENAVAAMRAGAADFLVKPIAPDRLLAALAAAADGSGARGELRPLSEKLSEPLAFETLVGNAAPFRAAVAVATKAARARVSVLIEGESGVGKEVFAEAIHVASPRGRKAMVCVNCGAIPANLVESELFGHERGAFTGAFDRRVGRFEEADGSTLFLDEVGELPLDAQVKLLRVLETGEVQPLGSRASRSVDVRVIAATNRQLADEVAAGRFREDLYYRLNVVQILIPPIRERLGDLPLLVRHLLKRIGQAPGMRPLSISEDALALLAAYRWPGNIRQLQNALFRAALMSETGELGRADFPQIAQATVLSRFETTSAPVTGIALYQPSGHIRPLEEIEADVIRLAIGHYRGRMTEVARRLGIGRSTLYRKLGELGIDHAA